MIGQASAAAMTGMMTVKTTSPLAPIAFSNRMTCTMETSSNQGSVADLGTFGHMRRIVQREGISGLWKGNVTRMVKVAPA
jgi:hypothetical protein